MKKNFSHKKEYKFQIDKDLKVEAKIEIKIDGQDIEKIGQNQRRKMIQKFAEYMHDFCFETKIKMQGGNISPITIPKHAIEGRKKILIEDILKEEGVTYGMAKKIISSIGNKLSVDTAFFLDNHLLGDIIDWNESQLDKCVEAYMKNS